MEQYMTQREIERAERERAAAAAAAAAEERAAAEAYARLPAVVGRERGALSTTTRSAGAATSDVRKLAVVGPTCCSETTSPPAHGDPGAGGGRTGAASRCAGTHVSASKALAPWCGAAAAVPEDSGGAMILFESFLLQQL